MSLVVVSVVVGLGRVDAGGGSDGQNGGQNNSDLCVLIMFQSPRPLCRRFREEMKRSNTFIVVEWWTVGGKLMSAVKILRSFIALQILWPVNCFMYFHLTRLAGKFLRSLETDRTAHHTFFIECFYVMLNWVISGFISEK